MRGGGAAKHWQEIHKVGKALRGHFRAGVRGGPGEATRKEGSETDPRRLTWSPTAHSL